MNEAGHEIVKDADGLFIDDRGRLEASHDRDRKCLRTAIADIRASTSTGRPFVGALRRRSGKPALSVRIEPIAGTAIAEGAAAEWVVLFAIPSGCSKVSKQYFQDFGA